MSKTSDLPGMWEPADLSGGWADTCRACAADRLAGEADTTARPVQPAADVTERVARLRQLARPNTEETP